MNRSTQPTAVVDDACPGTDHATHGMLMTFHDDYCETVLLECRKISSIGRFVSSLISIIIMAALYESLKYYRQYLLSKRYNALRCKNVLMPAEQNIVNYNNRFVQPAMVSWMHSFQIFLHIVQIILSYCLMLIFMTYNVWLWIAIAFGGAIGYFLFGRTKSTIVDVTEHCH